MTKTRSIALTGATGGIGCALVNELAAPDIALFLAGRDRAALNDLSHRAETRGAKVITCDISLGERERFIEALMEFHLDHPLDTLILAAGIKVGNASGLEDPDHLDRLIDLNLSAPIHVVQAVLPAMIARGTGQIALFSSLAAISPHADLLSYSASKAGIRAYGTALRQSLRGTGVTVSIISPGYVDTPMTDRQIGPTPQKISAGKAAKIIARGLNRERPYITFPLVLTALVRLKAMLPVWGRDWIDSKHRARILPDKDESLSDK